MGIEERKEKSMDRKPVISVIVPVYNVDPYLRFCVDSILAQTFGNFELILVDDGSTDDSGVICDEYAAKDGRVEVIHQEHQGVSAARNVGLDWTFENSNSAWIAFVDSDDAVACTYLECLYRYAVENDADITTTGATEFSEDGELDTQFADNVTDLQLMDGIQACRNLYEHRKWASVCSWGKLIKKELFHGSRFPKGKIYEDQYVIPQILYRADRIVELHTKLYHYRYRSGSITHQPFSLRRFEDIDGFDACIDFYTSCGDIEMASMAAKQKRCCLSQCIILAWRHRMQKEVPQKHRMSLWKAIMIAAKYNLKRGGLCGAWQKMCKVLR